MTTEIKEKLYTVQEFLELDLPDDDYEYELVGGRIVARPKSGVSAKHGKIVAKLSLYLGNYAKDGPTYGTVYSGASCTLGREDGANYVEPDVCFVLAGRTPDDFSGPIPVAPDLVVEVNSPSDTTERIHNKLENYRSSGVRLIWSVYMLEKFVLVYGANLPDVKLLNLNDELDGEEVLPNFKLKVSHLFD